MRFYVFIAQVVTLDDPRVEKLYAYLSWLLKLLPDRDVPPDAVITDDMLDLKAFRIERKEEGSASLKPGDTAALTPISEFGAKPMTEDTKAPTIGATRQRRVPLNGIETAKQGRYTLAPPSKKAGSVDTCACASYFWLSLFDGTILDHRVPLLRWRSGGVEHPHDTPPFPAPSPTSAHTSLLTGAAPSIA
jgi:hypothetical protein